MQHLQCTVAINDTVVLPTVLLLHVICTAVSNNNAVVFAIELLYVWPIVDACIDQ
jgi:hypothetical protein